ncbi:MAG: DNA sulfur modification protein DndB [Syntrophales bacterium]
MLKQIAQLPTSGPERLQIVKYRDEGWICLTATGLNIFGCIGYDLFTNGIKDMKDWKPYVDRFAEIDWRKSGPLWASTIIRDNRILTQNAPLRAAVLAVEDSEEKGGMGLSRVIRRPNSEPPAKLAPRDV